MGLSSQSECRGGRRHIPYARITALEKVTHAADFDLWEFVHWGSRGRGLGRALQALDPDGSSTGLAP